LPERPAQREPVRAFAQPAQPAQAEPSPRITRVERRQTQEAETSLPIGTRLTILDDNISFDEQISKLDQPLSMDANLLNRSSATPDRQESPATGVRFSGTPLIRVGVKTPQPIRPGEALHHVVERQIRMAHKEQGESASDFRHLDNPIENLQVALEKTWQSAEIRQQAMQSLLNNETFMQTFLHFLQAQGQELKAVEAAQEQLEDIEAERLSLLMQLETAKADYKQAMDVMYADLAQKKKDELNRLDSQIASLKTERDQLTRAVEALADGAQERTLQWMLGNDLQLCASNGETVALSPTLGVRRAPAEMVAAVRTAMNRRGFACNEDDATELLLHFALNDELCLCGDTLAEAELCARTLLEGLGLLGVTARTKDNTRLEIVSLLPETTLRAPTVEICTLGRAAIGPYGHKTIRLLEARSHLQGSMPLPVVYTPVFRPSLRDVSPLEPLRPTAIASFEALRDEAKPMMEQGEAWFEALEARLNEQNSALSGVTTRQMRVFVSAASAQLHGGFLAAADAAVLGWLIPEVFRCALNPEPLRQEIGCLPRCLAALGIR
ncbi:MAG TPA: hypothetical protein PLP25_01090, partial [Candidatus Limiplasma sp.]|nr:hypothetical protein [Candidatus Limiplasma sp.]